MLDYSVCNRLLCNKEDLKLQKYMSKKLNILHINKNVHWQYNQRHLFFYNYNCSHTFKMTLLVSCHLGLQYLNKAA